MKGSYDLIDIGFFILMFTGAVAFIFSLKTNSNGWFLFYTAVFAFCVAAVVVLM